MSSRHSVTKALEGAAKGSEQAEALIDQRFRGQLETLARKKLDGFGIKKRAVNEEDVAQIALAAFFRGLRAGQYPGATNRKSAGALLRAITEKKASNVARDERAEKRGGGKVRGDSANVGPDGESEPVGNLAVSREPTPDEAAEITEDVGRLVDLLNSLPESLRTVASLKMRRDLPNKEIAKKLGISETSVKDKWKLALAKMKKYAADTE